jgi:hypothetical protein
MDYLLGASFSPNCWGILVGKTVDQSQLLGVGQQRPNQSQVDASIPLSRPSIP